MKRLSKTGCAVAAIILSITLILGGGTLTFVASGAASEPCWAEEIPALLAAGNYVEGEVIAEAVFSGDSASGSGLLAAGEEVMDVTEAEEDLLEGQVPDDGEVHLVFIQRNDLSTEQILNRLAKDPRVLFAEPNYQVEAEEALDPEIVLSNAADSAKAGKEYNIRTSNIENLTPQQWNNTGQSDCRLEGAGDNSIHVPGFDTQEGNMPGDPVVVAVFDSALDFSNPDLAPVAFTFTEEQRKELECDVHGYNATAESTDGILKYWDEMSHGTHCAGIIGAAWDKKGISGVASNVRLVSVQNHTDNGYTSLVNNLRGIDFVDRANEMGCNISLINNSWGLLQRSRALDAAVRKLGDKWGTVCLFAAGNESRDVAMVGQIQGTMYDNPYVIIVSATDQAGNLASFSSYGKTTVDLGAPGNNILSTVSVNAAVSSFLPDAIPESDRKVYEGFEEGFGDIKISRVKEGENPGERTYVPAETELTTESRFAGKGGLKLPLDPDAVYGTSGDLAFYAICFEFGDLSERNVQPGDYFGFALGGKGRFGGGSFAYPDKETGKLKEALPNPETRANRIVDSYSDGWINLFTEIPETADLSQFKVALFLYAEEDQEALWIDSLGIASQLVPYGFSSGTSMACPAVCGFAAVLKAQDPTLSGADLAAAVKAKVRPNESIGNLTKTGGVIDFNVEGTGGSGQADPAPSVPKSENLFEEDLHLYRNTGDLFSFDAADAYETNGPIAVLGQKLYYLPDLMKTEVTPSYRTMLCYDTDAMTWSVLPSLPEWLWQICAVSYDDRIIVKGCTMQIAPDGSAIEAENPEARVYVYDPQKETWARASEQGVDVMDTLANNDGQLILAGGGGEQVYNPKTGNYDQEPAAVRTYELETGAGKKTARLHEMLSRPQVVCKDGTIYVLDNDNYQLERVKSGQTQSEVMKDALPDYLCTALVDWEIESPVLETERAGVLVPVKEGILFLGPEAADKSGDTFLLKDGTDKFEIYEKRMSDSKVSYPAAAACNGYVYAIGSALFEKGKVFFRRTALDTVQTPTVRLQKKTAVYTGKNIDIGKATVTETDATGKITYLYYTDKACTKAVSGHANAGTYYVKARIAADAKYSAFTSTAVTLTIKKAANTLKVKVPSKTYKRSKLKKARSFRIGTTQAQGKVTYVRDAKTKKAKIKVTAKGKVTIPKKCKKGTYRITVKAAGNRNYNAGSRTVKIRIR